MPDTATYIHPEAPPKPCYDCRWRDYDWQENSSCCSHDPPPCGLNEHRLVDGNGTCDFWQTWPKGDTDA